MKKYDQDVIYGKGTKVVNPTIRHHLIRKSSFNMPRNGLQIGSSQYYAIGKNAVRMPFEMNALPQIESYKQTPYDFVKQPKETKEEKFAYAHFKVKDVLEQREKRMEYMQTDRNNLLYNKNVLEMSSDLMTLTIDPLIPFNTKDKGKDKDYESETSTKLNTPISPKYTWSDVETQNKSASESLKSTAKSKSAKKREKRKLKKQQAKKEQEEKKEEPTSPESSTPSSSKRNLRKLKRVDYKGM